MATSASDRTIIASRFQGTAGAPWLPFVAAVFLWTAIASAVVFLNPGDQPLLLGCMRTVGRSAACEAHQEAINGVWWAHHTLPMLASIVAGYAGIALVRLRLIPFRRSPRRRSAA